MSLKEQFDFRMDKSSWAMIVFMLATLLYYLLQGGIELGVIDYVKGIGFAMLTLLVLIALMSIPVVIYCYFTKVIPDIDYSVRAAFVFTIIGIISELIM